MKIPNYIDLTWVSVSAGTYKYKKKSYERIEKKKIIRERDVMI